MKVRIVICILLLLLSGLDAGAKLSNPNYGIAIQEVRNTAPAISKNVDSLIYASGVLKSKATASTIINERVMPDKTVDFYLLIFLCLLLGIVRYSDRRYFTNLFRAFTNPSQSTAAREQLEVAMVSNMLMNLFFVVVGGVYVFYIMSMNKAFAWGFSNRLYSMLTLVGCIGLIYVFKYIILTFSGWVFKIKHITEYYTFNVFFVNKVMAILLLPMTVAIAFADAQIVSAVITLSAIIICVLFLYRYILSWKAFGAFFQYSWFHFFTYLCTSEILPMAVLMKLLFMNV
jgi:hypothetical protein